MNLAIVATSAVLSPILIVSLCALAAIGTVLLLPSRREGAIRGIGGTIVALAGAVLAATLIHHAGRNDDPMGLFFWLFSGVALLGALRVITHTRPVYSAIYFVLTVFASAGLFVLLWAEFMAVALVLIYAGAILVTYVFVIMLAARSGNTPEMSGEINEADSQSREPVAVSILGFGLMAVLLYVIFDKAPRSDAVAEAVPGDLSVRALADYLFRNQLVNLELAGVLLAMAMVGAIVIARRKMWNAQESAEPNRLYEKGDDNPHAIPVVGTSNPRQKAYPET